MYLGAKIQFFPKSKLFLTIIVFLTKHGGRKMFPNLFLFVTAQASAGKGLLTLCRHLAQTLHDSLKQIHAGCAELAMQTLVPNEIFLRSHIQDKHNAYFQKSRLANLSGAKTQKNPSFITTFSLFLQKTIIGSYGFAADENRIPQRRWAETGGTSEQGAGHFHVS